MTLDPLSIATKGYVCFDGVQHCPDDIAIGTKGYVGIVDVIIRRDGGDSSKGRRRRTLDTSLDALLTREDDEIISIIMAISKRRH
jgi:hypothetical protein